MSRSLAICLSVTDIFFMTYWAVALLALFNVFQLPPDLMYGDYTDPRVSAWNWSFFPLDLAFSVFGYLAVSAARRQAPVWRSYAIISLILTMTAGGMAVAYWAILREFDPSWFLPNLVIFAWPVFFLPGLIKGTAN